MRLRRGTEGVAAVEFALVLPLMLLLYVGTAELTMGLMASRKMNLAARAVADIVSQTAASTGVTSADLNNTITAALTIMSPFVTTPLKITVSSVEFVPNTATPPVYTAKPRWSVTYNGSTARPCAAATQVSNDTKPTSTTMPVGLYQAGTVIVADVRYTYTPTFGGIFFNSGNNVQADTGSIPMSQTTYMRPRTQYDIKYASTAGLNSGMVGTICAAY